VLLLIVGLWLPNGWNRGFEDVAAALNLAVKELLCHRAGSRPEGARALYAAGLRHQNLAEAHYGESDGISANHELVACCYCGCPWRASAASLMPQVQAAQGAPAAPAPNWVLMAGCRKPNSMTDCNPTPLLVDKKGRVFTVFGK
jgi:hypothetical protein